MTYTDVWKKDHLFKTICDLVLSELTCGKLAMSLVMILKL